MSCRTKVISVPLEHLGALLRGESVIANLPADGQIVGAAVVGRDLGVRVVSGRFEPRMHGEPLPVLQATIRRILKEEAA